MWLMASTQIRQSECSEFKSRSGQIEYLHGVKRLSTLGTGGVPGGSDSTQNSRASLSQNWGI